MSSFYKKGKKGRNTSLENHAIKEIQEIMEANGIDSVETATTPEELYALRDKLKNKYGSKAEAPKEEPKQAPVEEPKQDPVEEPKQDPVEAPAENPKEEFELTPTEEEAPASSPEHHFKISDFQPVQEINPFTAPFKKEDLFKAENEFRLDEEEVKPPTEDKFSQHELPEHTDATPNAWEIAKSRGDKPIESLEVEEVSSSSDEMKVKPQSETSKKATKSLAKQSAKIFQFISEWAVKRYAKVSEKNLNKMEEQDLIDRNFMVNGKTVAELIEDHNDLIDEMIKVDEDMKEDLVDALMLVAEKHQIEMSPESNLAMVVITIMISLGKAGYDAKQEMRKTLRKISDTYVLNKRGLQQAQDENAQLREEIKQLRSNNGNMGEQPTAQAPADPQVDPVKSLRAITLQ
jgi:hypothetical protein